MGESITFPTDDGDCPGYLAVSHTGSGPGVLVIQEWWGLVPHIADVCDRFAAEGFTAMAPDLYRGVTTSEPDEAGKLMMALNIEQATRDMSSAADHLLGLDAVVGDQLGVVGFCMGGGLALALATQRPDAIGACAPFYGVIPWPTLAPDYSRLDCPVRGQFAELDGFFGPDLARALEAQLRELGKDAQITIHDGCDHAFFNDTRPEVYAPVHAAEAWDATLGLFRGVL